MPRLGTGTLCGVAVAAALALGPCHAQAGGYYVGPLGAKASGRAGAFTARADDLSAVYYNPAGLAYLNGWSVQLEDKLSYNVFEFDREPVQDSAGIVTAEFDPVQSRVKLQPLAPLLGVGYGVSDWAFAFASFAKSGVSRMQYPESGPQRYMLVERQAILLNATASAAWHPRSDLSVGASVQWVAVPRIDYQMVVAAAFFGGSDPVADDFDLLATVQASDWFNINAIVGVWYQLSPAFELGLSAQVIPADIQAEGTLKLKFVNDVSAYGVTNQNVSTTRNGVPANDVQLTLPTPLSARLGARYVARNGAGAERFDVELDASYETWSVVDRFTLDTHELIAETGLRNVNIGVIQVEKHWNDTIGLSLGGDYHLFPEFLTVRAGVYWESAVAKAEYSNVDFASGNQLGATTGASLKFGPLSLALAYEFRIQPEVTTSTAEGRVYQVAPLEPDQKLVINGGAYRAHSHSLALGFTYDF